MSDRLVAVVRPWVSNIIPIDADFERQFDRFEYLLGLTHYDIQRAKGHAWGPVGCFWWRRVHGRSAEVEVNEEIEAFGPRWPLLAEGLFGGSCERLVESAKGFAAHVAAVRRQRS
jgi:hypothetical protein